jgi:hypothetical protein
MDVIKGKTITFKPLVLDAQLLMNKTIAIYGPSNTGKTVLTTNIINTLAGHIEQIFIISPTEATKPFYSSKIPSQLIHYKMWIDTPENDGMKEKDKVIEFIQSVWDRQEMISNIHAKANRIEPLKSLYMRCSTSDSNAKLSASNSKMARLREKLEEKHYTVKGKMRRTLADFDKKLEQIHILFYKMHILNNTDTLHASTSLESDEMYSLEYLRLNPRLLLIFDDSAGAFKSFAKAKVVRDLFYRNRHINTTAVFCCQDDTDLDSNLRRNVFISFFMREGVASSYFSRGTNGMPKDIARAIPTDVNLVIDPKGGKRFVYLRDDPSDHNYYYIDIEDVELCDFVPQSVRALCSYVAADTTMLDENNPFYNKFELDSKKRS